MTLKKQIILLIIFSIAVTCFAQNETILTLDHAIQIGLKNSFTIKQTKSLLAQSEHRLKAWKLYYASNANFTVDAPQFTNSFREIPDPVTGKIHIVRQNWVSHRSSLIINQPLLFTDGNLFLRNSFYNLRQKDEISYQSDITLNLNQPLFKTSTRKISLKKAEQNLSRAQISYYKQKRDLVYNITERFLNLVKSKKNLMLARDGEKRSREVYELAQAKFRTGLYSEMDLLKEKVEVVNDKNILINQEENYKNLTESFKLYIGLADYVKVEVDHIFVMDTLNISETELLKQAIKNNPDLLLNEKDIKLRELDIKQAKAHRQFTVDMNLEYGFSQNRNKFSDLFTKPDMTQIANISLNVPLWDSGQNNEEVLAAKEELSYAELVLNQTNEQLKVEINEIYSSYQKAKKLLVLNQENEANAQKSYQYQVMKFNAGSISSEDLARAREQLNLASLNNLNANIEYMLAMEKIKKHLSPVTEVGN
jgi:outer membrane protein